MQESFSLIVFAMLFASLPVLGQFKYDYTWAMGYDCCRGDENDNYLLDFNGGRLRIDTTTLQEQFFRAGQICDKHGRLALYTKGCKLYNGKNEMVVNGDSLIQSDSMPYYCFNTYGRQGIIFLPDYYSVNNYWLLNKSTFFRNYKRLPGQNLVVYDALRYSKIDASNYNGKGEVIIKNKPILHDTALTYGDMSVVKHANNKDWWLIVPTDRADLNYYTVLIGKNGVEKINPQKIGNKIADIGNGSDGFLFSPDGNKLARFFNTEGLFIFDFDREKGELSNFKKVDFPNDSSRYGGLAFSPSGRFLYVATDTILYQYDFWETDSTKAMMEVGWFDYFHERYYTTFYTMQLGPDCRIYMATYPTSRYLHVIKKPDLKGTACEFLQHHVQLPWYNDYYMPYYPNFRLGYEPVCDSTIEFVGNQIIQKEIFYLKLSPNPVGDQLLLELELQELQNLTFEIRDLNGQLVMRKKLYKGQSRHELDVNEFVPGMYVYTLFSNRGLLTAGKLVKI